MMGDITHIHHDSRQQRAESIMRKAQNLENKSINGALNDFTVSELFIIRESLWSHEHALYSPTVVSHYSEISDDHLENLLRTNSIIQKLNKLIKKYLEVGQ